VARDRAPFDVGEARQGKLVWRGSGGRLEDTCQLGGAHVLMLMLKVMEVKGLVTVKVVLEMKVVVKVFEVVVKVLEEALLFSLSSTPPPTTTPSTRPAGRCLGFWG